MTWVWTGLMLAAVVAVGICRWRDGRQTRVERQAQHNALVQQILTADPEISQLEACWRLPDYERQEHPNA